MHASKHSTKKEMYTEKPVMDSTEIDDSEANTICSESTTNTPVFSTTVPSSSLGNILVNNLYSIHLRFLTLNLISQQLIL